MSEAIPAQRCCTSHESWTELTEHLIACFPDVPVDKITEIVVGTRRAEDTFGLPDAERLDTAEIVARYQLLQMTGQLAATVRLDPETHDRGTREPSEG